MTTRPTRPTRPASLRHLLRAAACGAALLVAVPAPAGERQDDLQGRRARLMERLGPDAMLVAFSAPPRTYSRNIRYAYRQDSNLYYLTGIEQTDTILVLMPGNLTRREILFIRERNPAWEHREGRLLSAAEARTRSGIRHVYTRPAFEPFVEAMLSRRPYDLPRTAPPAEYEAFFTALAAGRGRVALFLDPGPGLAGGAPDPPHAFAGRLTERFPAVPVQDASAHVHALRQVKTAYEQRVLARSLEITAEGHRDGMRATAPGRYEYEVQAAIEAAFMRNGAMQPGYPSIVGSGPNATILHYRESQRRMEAGDLLLVDAAASFQGLTGDVTRTYPVSGTFSGPQQEIYRLVLAAQEAGMRAARPGARTADIEQAAEQVIRQGLLRLGLVTDAAGDQFRTWYTHGICHWIGMDVHDVGDYGRPLEPGMAFVIEPGLYIREEALAHLPDTPGNAAFIRSVRPAVERYRNIGVRIEDSFLLTASGLTRLSAGVPRTIEEIEAFLADGGRSVASGQWPAERARCEVRGTAHCPLPTAH